MRRAGLNFGSTGHIDRRRPAVRDLAVCTLSSLLPSSTPPSLRLHTCASR
jgi:hypothetical protein